MSKKKALGRGLSALIEGADDHSEKEIGSSVNEIEITDGRFRLNQPCPFLRRSEKTRAARFRVAH